MTSSASRIRELSNPGPIDPGSPVEPRHVHSPSSKKSQLQNPDLGKKESVKEKQEFLFQKILTKQTSPPTETRARQTPFLHVLFQRVFHPRLRHRAHNLVDPLPVLEDEQGRNSHNIESSGRCRVLVRVQLPKSHLSLVLLGKRVNDGGDETARPTPGRPAVNED